MLTGKNEQAPRVTNKHHHSIVTVAVLNKKVLEKGVGGNVNKLPPHMQES